MSNTNGQVSFVKSMNGILSFSTGSGTTIEGDSITTDIINCDTLNTTNFNATNFNTNNIQGINPSDNITLYTNSTGDIHIGSANSLNYVDGPLYVDNIFGTTTGTAFIYPNVVADINIGSATIPITGEYVCTASNHLANKGYVDSMVGVNLIPLSNVWTGTSNTFNNKIIVNTIDALNVGDTVDLYGNLSTGLINFGINTTSGAINIGNASATGSFSVSQGTINLNSKTTLNMANQIGAGTVNICNANTYAGTLNIASTAHSSATANTLNIGSTTSNMTINSKTLSINSTTDIDILKPLSPSYTYNATTGTTVSTSIGYQITGTINAGTSFSTTNGTATAAIGSIALTTGIWLINFVALYSNTVSNAIADFDFISLRVGTAATTNNIYSNSFFGGGQLRGLGLKGDAQNIVFTIVYNALTSQTIYLNTRAKCLNVNSININTLGTGASDDGPAKITATRIA